MTTRVLIDAQLPPGLAGHLCDAGWDAVHVASLGLLHASDDAIWRKAIELGAAIMSKDEDS